jgi:hypothetical protein
VDTNTNSRCGLELTAVCSNSPLWTQTHRCRHKLTAVAVQFEEKLEDNHAKVKALSFYMVVLTFTESSLNLH